MKTLKRRFCQHHSEHKRFLAGKTKTREYSSSKVFEHGDATIELIEETEDEGREYYWIRELNACNTKRNLHFDGVVYNKVYYAENKEKCNATAKKKIPCPKCAKVVSYSNMAAHKRTKSCQEHGL